MTTKSPGLSEVKYRFARGPTAEMSHGGPYFGSPFEATFDPSITEFKQCFVYRFDDDPVESRWGPIPFYLSWSARNLNLETIRENRKEGYFFRHCIHTSLMHAHVCPELEIQTRLGNAVKAIRRASRQLRAHAQDFAMMPLEYPSAYRALATSVEMIVTDAPRWTEDRQRHYRWACSGANMAFWGVRDKYLAVACNWLPLTFESAEGMLQDLSGTTWRKGYIGLRLLRRGMVQGVGFRLTLATQAERGRRNVYSPVELEKFLREDFDSSII